MNRLSSAATILLVLACQGVGQAETYSVPLSVGGSYEYGQSVPFEFDLGVPLLEVQQVRFVCAGTVTAGVSFYTSNPVSWFFAANLPAESGLWTAEGPWVGAVTYPSPESFTCEAVFEPYSGATWDFLLDGATSGSVDFPLLVGPMFRQLPSGWITEASLSIDATPVPEPPEPQKICLAWDINAPYGWRTETDDFGNEYGWYMDGSLPAATVDESYKAEVRSELEAIFDRSNVHNIEFVDNLSDDAAIVFFAERPSPQAPWGRAFRGAINRWNTDPGGDAVVLPIGNGSIDAWVAAHELGHIFGLRHVDNSGSSVMGDNAVPDLLGDTEQFVNRVAQTTDPLETHTHNTQYHLRRYVDGVPRSELIAAGVMPGTWDEEEDTSEQMNVVQMDFGANATMLYDVTVLGGSPGARGAESLEQIEQMSAVSLVDLSGLKFVVHANEVFVIFAASSPGSEKDIVLSTGSPFDDDGVFMRPPTGDTSVSFYKSAPESPSGYVELAGGSMNTTIVPEPMLGDVNDDGQVNGLDVDPFVDVLLNGPYQAAADMNDDQLVNGLDVDPFVAAVISGGAEQIPEPSTILLCLFALGVVGGWRKWKYAA